MPRQARLFLEGVCYHIITRGNQKQAIFKDENDFDRYMWFLAKYKRRFGVRLYGWCLMPNHVHLLLESGNVPQAMHGINMSYAQYYQYKYTKVGHVWQDRYKSLVIQKDKYLINCVTYIEYNPVRGNLALRPEEYRWSSYNARVLGQFDNGLLDDLLF